MLCNDKLGKTTNVVALTIFARFGIVLWSVDEANDIGILLNGTTLTKVAKLWTLATVPVRAKCLLTSSVSSAEASSDVFDIAAMAANMQAR